MHLVKRLKATELNVQPSKDDIEKYQILEKYLQYDSSLVVKDNEINKYINNGKYEYKLKVLHICS